MMWFVSNPPIYTSMNSIEDLVLVDLVVEW